MDNTHTKLFRAVIVARSCPKVLETQLRKHSQNIRNVETLPGNAIAVFPSSHSITVAIRVYHLDEPAIAAMNKLQAKSTRILMSDPDPAVSLDFDHLQSFRDSFKFPVVFFISHRLQEVFAQQLEDPHSVLHRAQDALVCAPSEDEAETTQVIHLEWIYLIYIDFYFFYFYLFSSFSMHILFIKKREAPKCFLYRNTLPLFPWFMPFWSHSSRKN